MGLQFYFVLFAGCLLCSVAAKGGKGDKGKDDPHCKPTEGQKSCTDKGACSKGKLCISDQIGENAKCCKKDYCKPTAKNKACSESGACPPGRYCVKSGSKSFCCPSLFNCNSARKPTKKCKDDDDCAQGYFCSIGSKKRVCCRNPCADNPCKNGKTCRLDFSSKQGYSCVCNGGHCGNTCDNHPEQEEQEEEEQQEGEEEEQEQEEEQEDICRDKPNICGVNGICHSADTNRGYQCQCTDSYTGFHCEIAPTPPPSPCDTQPCKNGGTCSVTSSGFSCQCRNPYIPPICEMKDICGEKPTPCGENGICHTTETNRGYRCECINSYTGDNCEIAPQSCTYDELACGEYGVLHTDMNNPNGFVCQCVDGYSGDFCQIPPEWTYTCTSTNKKDVLKILPRATWKLQTFSSPGFDDTGYFPSMNCTWRLDSGSPDDRVVIDVQRYNIEQGLGCYYDSLTFYDGGTINHNSKKICGDGKIGTVFVTSGQYGLLQLKSDFSDQFEGFKMRYLKGKNQAGDGCMSGNAVLMASGATKYITNHHWPELYNTETNCGWHITAVESCSIEIKVLFMDLVTSNPCSSDKLEIYDGEDDRAPLLTDGVLCDSRTSFPNKSMTFHTTGPIAFISFKSIQDPDVNERRGFVVSYKQSN